MAMIPVGQAALAKERQVDAGGWRRRRPEAGPRSSRSMGGRYWWRKDVFLSSCNLLSITRSITRAVAERVRGRPPRPRLPATSKRLLVNA